VGGTVPPHLQRITRFDGFPVNVRFFPSTLESVPLIVAVITTSSALGEITVIELILFVGMFRPKLVWMAITPSQ